MRKTGSLFLVLLGLFILSGCNLWEAGMELMNNPPTVKSVDVDLENEQIILEIESDIEKSEMTGIYINGNKFVLENDGNNVYRFDFFDLEYKNAITGIEITVDGRSVNVPMDVELDTFVLDFINEYANDVVLTIKNDIEIAGFYKNVTTQEEIIRVIKQSTMLNDYMNYLNYVGEDLFVSESFFSNNTVLLLSVSDYQEVSNGEVIEHYLENGILHIKTEISPENIQGDGDTILIILNEHYEYDSIMFH